MTNSFMIFYLIQKIYFVNVMFGALTRITPSASAYKNTITKQTYDLFTYS